MALGWLGALVLLPLGASAPPTPTVKLVAQPNAGTVWPGTSNGTVVIGVDGTRTVNPGTYPGGTTSFSPGVFSITYTPGATVKISKGGGGNVTLTNQANSRQTMSVAYSSLNLSSTSVTIPGTGTSGNITFGFTVSVNTSTNCQTGTYQGTLYLKLQDATKHPYPPAVSQPFTVTIKVDTTPITLTPGATSLSFGSIVAGSSAGTAVVSPAGPQPPTGGVTLIPSNPGTAALFTVGGLNGATYSITLPPALPNNITLTSTVGGYKMTVDTFTSSPSGAGILDATTGKQSLAVGATLRVGAGQPPGLYKGAFSLTVAYN